MKTPSIVVLGLSLTAAGMVLAQSGSLSFSELDVNLDGNISVNEAEKQSTLLEQFNNLDSDRDGKLTRMEFAVFEETDDRQ